MESQNLLAQIVERGGLLGQCAKMYLNDEVKAKQFVRECFEQRDNPSMQKYLGEKLLSDIIKFNRVKSLVR
jgi:hypothetical protein